MSRHRLLIGSLALVVLASCAGPTSKPTLSPQDATALTETYLAPYHPTRVLLLHLTQDSSGGAIALVSITVPTTPPATITLNNQAIILSYDRATHRYFVDEQRTLVRGALDNMLATQRAIRDARSGAHKLTPTTWSK